MPKKRKNLLIQCTHFKWRLVCRNGIWYADGRSNSPSAGRHSLETPEKDEARRILPQLDQRIAEDRGLCPRSSQPESSPTPLELGVGRKLYEEYLARPRSVGGVKPSTRKRYRPVFDKFLPYAQSQVVTDWRDVDAGLLTRYAGYLEKLPRSPKTQRNELVVLVQTVKWLIDSGHLFGKERIKLKFGKIESERAYCWRTEEVAAIVQFCQAHPKIAWLGDVVVALACSGLRISELAAMRWRDIDLPKRMLFLPDESSYASRQGLEPRDRKSGRGRSFPIHADLLPVLIRQSRKGDYVFRGPRGGRLKPDYVRNVLVNKVVNKLAEQFPSPDGARGFRDGRLHSFRHYFASMCAHTNVPILTVMEWLGHQDSSMVRHYFHLHDAESRRQMDRLNPLGNADKKTTG
jgi:integrase